MRGAGRGGGPQSQGKGVARQVVDVLMVYLAFAEFVLGARKLGANV